MESVGMMDEGYFVSRNEILTWMNNLLQVLFISFHPLNLLLLVKSHQNRTIGHRSSLLPGFRHALSWKGPFK